MADEETPNATPERSKVKRVSTVIESGLWPELPQKNNEDLVGTDFVIVDYRELTSAQFPDPETGKPGKYFIIKCAEEETGEEFTTACGGKVIGEQLLELKERHQFPILAAFKKVKSKTSNRTYYTLE